MVGPVPNILCPANLLPVKGHKHLLQAVAILKRLGVNCAVDLAGDGPLRLSLQEQVADLAVSDCVTFLGQLSHDEILARYRDPALTAVVLPSVDLGNGIHEGIPVALIEAMSFGVPVISTLTGGIPELLGEGAGILVPPAEPAALANAITRVIQDSSLRTRLSLAGRDRVMREFSARSSVEALRRRFASSRAGRFEGRPGRRAA
jgi:glycosyltransferase involved in cell wall biosynthesis